MNAKMSGGYSSASTGGVGTTDASTAGVRAVDVSTGGVGTADVSTGGVGTADASTAGVGAVDVSTGGVGAADVSTGGVGTTGASTAGLRYTDLRYQVMWNRLISVVEEQALTLVRASFSTSVREAGDLSAGIFDSQGRMIAQAVTGTPGHVNTMAAAVKHFINDIGQHRIYEGDVYVTNDPWKGTGHLHDFTVVTPAFRHGELIGYFADTVHVVDIGGRGFGPDAREVYEEGLRIPVMKLVERGKLNRDLIEVIRVNVREPDQIVGDLHSLAAGNDTGIARLHAMLDEVDEQQSRNAQAQNKRQSRNAQAQNKRQSRNAGAQNNSGGETLEGVASFVFERTRAATVAAIERVPQGVYHNKMTVDGYNKPVTLAVALEVGTDGIHADFTGTSPTSSYGVNVPLAYAQAYMTYGLLCALAPGLPNNAASLAPFTVSAPEGCILNAVHPDPVAVRHVIGHFVTDLCLGAVAPALPDVIPAEGSGALWNFQASIRPTRTTAQIDASSENNPPAPNGSGAVSGGAAAASGDVGNANGGEGGVVSGGGVAASGDVGIANGGKGGVVSGGGAAQGSRGVVSGGGAGAAGGDVGIANGGKGGVVSGGGAARGRDVGIANGGKDGVVSGGGGAAGGDVGAANGGEGGVVSGGGALGSRGVVSGSDADAAQERVSAEVLMFNSGGTGARPGLDGLSATAFPSGVRTMSVEATEQVGPIILWRKELRPDSGGAGTHRGGLGQVIELGPAEGYELHFSAMFDRVAHPARGRNGGDDGAAGRVVLDDGTPFNAKGKQLVPAGRRLILELPGGGGWGDPQDRAPEMVERDVAQGYVSQT